jgi:hypothetical protein
MTTTSGYSGRPGGRSSRYVPDLDRNVRLHDYREAHTKIAKRVAVAAVAVDGLNETEHDDERQTVYGDRSVRPMDSAE